MTPNPEARWWISNTLLFALTIAALTNMTMLTFGRGDSRDTRSARRWFSGTMNNIDKMERDRAKQLGLPLPAYPSPTLATQP